MKFQFKGLGRRLLVILLAANPVAFAQDDAAALTGKQDNVKKANAETGIGVKAGSEANEAKTEIKPEKDNPFGRREWFGEWFGPVSNEYLDYKTKVGEREIEKWGHLIPGARKYYKRRASAGNDLPPNQWVNIGPFDGFSLQTITDPNVADAGRPTVILPHPTNPNVIYVGFAGGGLWRSRNANLATNDDWVWAPMTDGLPSGGNTAIGAAAFKHDDPNTIYISLGDMMPASAPHGTAEGRGFYISKDGGETWDRGGELGKCNMTKTIVSLPGNVILVAGNMGLFRSTNGGITFTRVQSGPLQDGTGVSYSSAAYPPNEYATAWDILKLNNGRLVLTYQFCDGGGSYDGSKPFIGYGYFGGGGIAWSEDNGATWTKATVSNGTATAPSDRGFGRIAIAASGNTLYGLYQIGDVPDSDRIFPNVLLKSSDGGKTWVTNGANNLYSASDLLWTDGGQAGYNHLVAVDPDNPDVVFVGTNLNMYRSTDGGANFSQFTSWISHSYQYTHADMHAGVWTPPGRPKALYIATDGGLSILRQPNINPIPTTPNRTTLSSPEIIDHRRNRGLATHLVYNLGATNADTPAGSRDRVIIGTQDNGTLLRKNIEKNYYSYVIGGDGFGCLIHPYNGDKMLGTLYNTWIYRSVNGGAHWTDSISGIDRDGDPNGTPFYTRLIQEMADPTGNRVYTFTNSVPYVSNDFGQTWTRLPNDAASGWPTPASGDPYRIRNMGASPLKRGLVGALIDLNQSDVTARRGTVVISEDGGQTWRYTLGAFPGNGGNLGDIAFDTADPNIMYVSSVRPGAWNVAGVTNGHLFNHLWKSLDGGYTWAAIDGALENQNGIPFGTPIHVVKVDPIDNQTVYAGTEYGLYYTTNQGDNWERFGYDLPMVPVRDIYIAPDGSFMRVGTHGRGVWETLRELEDFAPKISAHPQDIFGTAIGEQATFMAHAIGRPAPTYQWQITQISADGSPTWANIPGATSNTYSVTIHASDTIDIAKGFKRFRVIARNPLGSATSDASLLYPDLFNIDGAPGADVRDLLKFQSLYGSDDPAHIILADFNGDGKIDDEDLAILLNFI
ncbi:MAG: hypothetical protein LBQ86_07980 [Holophagales bacterium]|nr:hypothetical protein [Holophagales bacterium]